MTLVSTTRADVLASHDLRELLPVHTRAPAGFAPNQWPPSQLTQEESVDAAVLGDDPAAWLWYGLSPFGFLMFVHWVNQQTWAEYTSAKEKSAIGMIPARMLLDDVDVESASFDPATHNVMRAVLRAWLGADSLLDAFYRLHSSTMQTHCPGGWLWQQTEEESRSRAQPSPYRSVLQLTIEQALSAGDAAVAASRAKAAPATQEPLSELARQRLQVIRQRQAAFEEVLTAANTQRRAEGLLPLPSKVTWNEYEPRKPAAEHVPAATSWSSHPVDPQALALYEHELLSWDSHFWADHRDKNLHALVADGVLPSADRNLPQLHQGQFALSAWQVPRVAELMDPQEVPMFAEAQRFITQGLCMMDCNQRPRSMLLEGPPGCGKTYLVEWSVIRRLLDTALCAL
jgi:hypothetical protein